MTINPWTDHAVDLLKIGVAAGASYSTIAAEIGNGVTRSAVAGKAQRMGSKSPLSPVALHEQRKTKSLHAAMIVKMTAPITEIPPEVFPDGGITFAKLKPRSCRWSSGDPKTPEFRFCGAMADSGSWCCSLHRKVAYIPGSSKAAYSHRAAKNGEAAT